MNTNPMRLLAAVLPMALLLAACGGKNDDAPTVRVTDLAAGVYAVGAGDAANPNAGKYYAGADGSRLLVLNDSEQQATAVYRRDGNGSWNKSPAANADASLDLLGSTAIPSNPLALDTLAGRYTVRLASGAAAAFSVSASGDIVAGATDCKLSGRLAPAALPEALKLTLSSAGCGALPASAEGFLVVDRDYAPAAFRLITSGSTAPADLWAYKD